MAEQEQSYTGYFLKRMFTEEAALELYADLVCDSGRVYCEMAFTWLDRAKAASVDFAAVTTPVLAIGAESDKTVDPRVPRTTATKYRSQKCSDNSAYSANN